MSKQTKKGPSKKKPGTLDLNPKTLPASIRWRLDYTYLEKLNPEELNWLNAFSARYYGADHRVPEGEEPILDWSVEERRASYRAKNAANSDVYSALESGHILDSLDDHPGLLDSTPPRDIGPTPEYLNSPEYKAARDDFRKHLDQNRRPRDPKPSPALDEARARLMREVKNDE